MEYARGKETEPFGWCIREGRARMAQASPYPGFHRVYSYVERGFYGRQLARLLELFPRDQLLIMNSEELKFDPTVALGRVCDFLAIDRKPGPVGSRISRPAAEIDYPATLTDADVTFLQRLYRDEIDRFRYLSGD